MLDLINKNITFSKKKTQFNFMLA